MNLQSLTELPSRVVGHVLLQEVYKAVVARNPVVDLPSILFESDIPDW